VLAIVLVGITPLYDRHLGAPPDYNAYAYALQFLVQIPALLATLAGSLRASEHAAACRLSALDR